MSADLVTLCDHRCCLDASIQASLDERKAKRGERSAASLKGWATRKRATRFRASRQATSCLGPSGFNQAQAL